MSLSKMANPDIKVPLTRLKFDATIGLYGGKKCCQFTNVRVTKEGYLLVPCLLYSLQKDDVDLFLEHILCQERYYRLAAYREENKYIATVAKLMSEQIEKIKSLLVDGFTSKDRNTVLSNFVCEIDKAERKTVDVYEVCELCIKFKAKKCLGEMLSNIKGMKRNKITLLDIVSFSFAEFAAYTKKFTPSIDYTVICNYKYFPEWIYDYIIKHISYDNIMIGIIKFTTDRYFSKKDVYNVLLNVKKMITRTDNVESCVCHMCLTKVMRENPCQNGSCFQLKGNPFSHNSGEVELHDDSSRAFSIIGCDLILDKNPMFKRLQEQVLKNNILSPNELEECQTSLIDQITADYQT